MRQYCTDDPGKSAISMRIGTEPLQPALFIGTRSSREEAAVRSQALEHRKHRQTVLFGIGLQLRRIYDVAEREPVPDRIARLLNRLDDSGGRGAQREAGSAKRRDRS